MTESLALYQSKTMRRRTSKIREQEKVIEQALEILFTRMKKKGVAFTSADDSANYIKLHLADAEREVFCVLYLDNQHQLLEYVPMFAGTIDSSQVTPREVVKHALKVNAAAVILGHNHPSGRVEASESDIRITKQLQDTLRLIDVRVLDHIIVGGAFHSSFAQNGLM